MRQTASTLADDPASLEKVYDTARLPGAATPSRQVYNELAVMWDTRTLRGNPSPGVAATGYMGVSLGVGGDESRSSRTGGDLAVYLPLWRPDRLLVPRIALDALRNLNEAVPFSFMTYPRQLPFRNVNTAITLLRQDDVVANASLEYQWPLSRALTAGLFTQGIFVGPSVDKMAVEHAPWDAGLKVELHTSDAPVLMVWAAYGSQGLYVWFQMGVVDKTNDRWRWY
jgi:hypothetical protein